MHSFYKGCGANHDRLTMVVNTPVNFLFCLLGDMLYLLGFMLCSALKGNDLCSDGKCAIANAQGSPLG